jgi:CelD/BcsL family acetyltransferase involved in cellulose biosynthesis
MRTTAPTWFAPARAPGSYRVETIDVDLAEVGLAAWWDALPQVRANPMLRWDWQAAWHDAFTPRDARLHIPVVFCGDDPVAALPLYRRHQRLHTLSSDAHSDVSDLGCEPEHPGAVAPLADLVLRRRTCLERLDRASPLLAALLRSAPPMIVDDEQSPVVDLPGTVDGLLAQLSSKFRASVRRACRALDGLGTVTLTERHGEDPDAAEAFGHLLALESASWKGSDGTAIASQPDTLRFYRRIALEGPARRWARLDLLRVDDRVVAAQLDLELGARRYGLKMASDADLGARQSPGTVLLFRTLESCIERGISAVELGGEVHGWKRHWATSSTDRARVRTWPATAAGRVAFGTRERVKRAVRPLRHRRYGVDDAD